MLEAYVHLIHEMESRLQHEKKKQVGPMSPTCKIPIQLDVNLVRVKFLAHVLKPETKVEFLFFFCSPSHMNSLSCGTLLVLASLFCISSFLFFFISLNYFFCEC